MSCDSTRLNLLAYLHDQVDPDQVSSIERHLATCPLCAAQADQLRSEISKLTLAMAAIEMPARFEDRVMRRLRHRAHTVSGGLTSPADWLRAGALAAASVAMAISSLSVISPNAYAMVVTNAAWVGSRVSGLASQHIATWPALLRALEALETLVGLAGL